MPFSAAHAQFPPIFGGPPRPPANVPGQAPQRAPAPLGLPEQMPPEEMDDDAAPPPQRPLPPAARTQPPTQSLTQPPPQPGAVRSQPLAPPAGVTAAPPSANLQPGAASPPIQPGAPAPGQRPPLPRGNQPANTAPQPGDEVVTEFPSQKIANPTAVFAGLDKITGRIISFDVALNEKVQFGALQVTPRVCYTRPPTESANTDSFIEIDEVTLQGEVKRLFTGWMFASSPGLHAVEHPIYDIWLTDCKGGTTVMSDAQPTAPGAAAPGATTGQRPSAPRTGSSAAAPARQTQPPPVQQQQPAQQQSPQQQQLAPVPPPGFAVPRR
jgi:hypothetical protein